MAHQASRRRGTKQIFDSTVRLMQTYFRLIAYKLRSCHLKSGVSIEPTAICSAHQNTRHTLTAGGQCHPAISASSAFPRPELISQYSCQQWALPLIVRTYSSTAWRESQDPILCGSRGVFQFGGELFGVIKICCASPAIELTGSANSCHTSSPPTHWPCYHSPGGTKMWQICFAVFVIPTAVITALAIVEILVYGGDL